jgi:hypothetical protein
MYAIPTTTASDGLISREREREPVSLPPSPPAISLYNLAGVAVGRAAAIAPAPHRSLSATSSARA